MNSSIGIFLGCYSDENNINALKVISLDETTLEMSVVSEYPVSNALYQTISHDRKYLYSCTGEGLASFRINDNKLEEIDRIKIGNCVCHVAAMPNGNQVVWADYLGGLAGCVNVKDGKFSSLKVYKHEGSGPNLPRQDKAHCHQAMPTPDGKSYCVIDLGIDEIVTYPEEKHFKTSPSGAGPRHILFHPNKTLAFLAFELGNLIGSLKYENGEFKILDTLPTLDSEKDTPVNLVAAIRFTPDMKRVVISNRGENSLVVYDFDELTGKLSFKSRTFLSGNWPRDFIFVNDTLALVACERSGEVTALKYDSENATFCEVTKINNIFRPVALLALKA
jgi:6-phosphogluconolactonase